MALGLGKKSCEALGIKVSDVGRVEMLAPHNHNHWNATRDKFRRLFPATDRWIAQCYNMPSYRQCVISMLDELLEGFGVEAIRSEKYWDNYYGDCVAEYVNMGETYALTVIRKVGQDNFFISSLGDFVESNNL